MHALKKIHLLSNLFVCSLLPALRAQSPADAQIVQQQKLLNNPDIVWVWNATATFCLDAHQAPNNRSSGFSTIKLTTDLNRIFSKISNTDYGHLSEKLVAADFFAKNKIYRDAAFTQESSEKEIWKEIKDEEPHEWFDPSTFKEIKKAAPLQFNPKDVPTFELKMWVYFDQKNNAFGLKAKAFCPRYEHPKARNAKNNLFYIPVEELSQAPDLKNPNISLAKRCVWKVHFGDSHKENSPKITKILSECISSHLLNIRKNAAKEDIRDNLGMLQKMPTSQIALLGADKTEKVQVTDPETGISSIQTITSKFDPESLVGLSFIQEWYWDESTQKLSYRNLFYAPLFQHSEVEGDLIWFWKAAAP